jgi:putative salt-induced outer membrane protein
MKKILAIALLSALTSSAFAQWKGAGEFGLAITGGSTETTNINGKLGLVNESDAWKHEFGLGLLRASSKQFVVDLTRPTAAPVEQTVKSANRYDVAWTSGYKLSDTSYIFGSLRHENDDFSIFEKQTVAALGYGIYPIKTEDTTLLFEAGLGYRQATLITTGDSDGEAVFRGKIDFNTKLTESTALFNTFLVEAGSDSKYYQNDLGVAVKMSDAFAVKTGFQLRRNTVKNFNGVTDRLFTTNLVYSF